jgi:hypothetical protein
MADDSFEEMSRNLGAQKAVLSVHQFSINRNNPAYGSSDTPKLWRSSTRPKPSPVAASVTFIRGVNDVEWMVPSTSSSEKFSTVIWMMSLPSSRS